MTFMNHSLIFIALVFALGATVGALLFGLFALLKGDEFNKKHGNQAMRWRILLQAIALILFLFMLTLRR